MRGSRGSTSVAPSLPSVRQRHLPRGHLAVLDPVFGHRCCRRELRRSAGVYYTSAARALTQRQAVRHHAGRLPARRHRQLHHRRRADARPARDLRRQRRHRHRRVLGDQPVRPGPQRLLVRSFDTFIRDVDFSPDGSFFVVTHDRRVRCGTNTNTLCDTSQPLGDRPAPANDPTWVAYTGGDTSYGVAVTGAVVYIGGHMRWLNNPFQGDQAGPGAVPREGISALDPVNGIPLSWNPGRDPRRRRPALFATPPGPVGRQRHHQLRQPSTRGRVAFLPLAGGGSMPQIPAAHSAQRPVRGPVGAARRQQCPLRGSAAGTNARPGHRRRPRLVRPDDGRVSGGSSADLLPRRCRSTPRCRRARRPSSFLSERYGASRTGTSRFAVRPEHHSHSCYFANQYAGTVGSWPARLQRPHRRRAPGSTTSTSSPRRATRSAPCGPSPITSDGNVDIDLAQRRRERQLINGIEILDNNSRPAPSRRALRRAERGRLGRTHQLRFDGLCDGGLWRRSARVPDERHASTTASSDNSLYKRTLLPRPPERSARRPSVNLYDDPHNGTRIPFAISTMTGMFFDPETHRIYYTVSGDSRLFYRCFAPQSDIVGAQTLTADAGGVNFSTAPASPSPTGRSTTVLQRRQPPFCVVHGGRVTPPTVVSSDARGVSGACSYQWLSPALSEPRCYSPHTAAIT